MKCEKSYAICLKLFFFQFFVVDEYSRFVDFCMYRNLDAVRYDANRMVSNDCNRKSCSIETLCASKLIFVIRYYCLMEWTFVLSK